MSQNVIIATGYRSKVAYQNETISSGIYGQIPINTTYKWIGAATEVVAHLDQQPIIIYRLDGISRFPSYILQGARQVDLDVTFFPQDITLLNDVINFPQSNSHTFGISYTDINQGVTVNGAVANTIRFEGRTGQALATTVSYYAQNISNSSPTGITYPTDPGNNPFYFTGESVSFAGTTMTRVLQFDATVTNNLQRVYQFGQAYVRAIPRLNARIEGTLQVTFADMSDFNNVINMSGSTMVINLGVDGTSTTRSLTVSTATFTTTDIPSKPEDLIAITMDFVGEGVTIS